MKGPATQAYIKRRNRTYGIRGTATSPSEGEETRHVPRFRKYARRRFRDRIHVDLRPTGAEAPSNEVHPCRGRNRSYGIARWRRLRAGLGEFTVTNDHE